MKRAKYLDERTMFEYTACLMDPSQNDYMRTYPTGYEYNAINEQTALCIIRFAIEEFLCWTPLQAAELLDTKTIRKMKLTNTLSRINIPFGMVTDEDYTYILEKIYPDVVEANLQDLTLRSYEIVLEPKDERHFFPQKFFMGAEGRERAAICTHYLLSRTKGFFKNTEDLYDFFSRVSGYTFLTKNKLKFANVSYGSNVNLINHTLNEEERNEMMMHYYQFIEAYWYHKRILSRMNFNEIKANRDLSETAEENGEIDDE